MKAKKSFVVSAVFALLTLLLIVLVKSCDVSEWELTGTPIGLYGINTAVHRIFGMNIMWYSITELFGILALLVCAVFAFVGLLQLIKRKSLFKVDPLIIKLGGLYVVVLALYALFEKVVINYRPEYLFQDELEASFPSSHTMLICVVMGSAVMVLGKYVRNENMAKLLKILCIVIMIITVIGRLICGVHWFTDILGGVFISIALLALFRGIAAPEIEE
ncbi:phosphatase PAP2 family protein [Butyrivibrio sp. VCD2006]|uniref:phosphatase PAP2 family protein n=1 Tax=Butyrivibrio sp. VCD2006 TaxID=1280664 RepID=UPI000426ADA3|nr:phosphatase PAP2 family protein [Butyrivibrio sp. VCD2006]